MCAENRALIAKDCDRLVNNELTREELLGHTEADSTTEEVHSPIKKKKV